MADILDFNNATRQSEARADGISAEAIRGRLNAAAEGFIQWLFSGRAHIARGSARVGDVHGTPGASLSISLTGPEVGLWHDHATDEGGDLIALYRACMGYSGNADFVLSLKEIARDFFNDPIEIERSAWRPTPIEKIEQDKIRLGTLPREDMIELGAPVASYKYFDTRGNVLASVTRYEPDGSRESKTFRPYCFRTVEGKTRWMPGAPDLRPLYRLPEISLAASVVLVEGEGKAEALAHVGIEATSAMQGASAPIEKTDWSVLAGKTVTIWPDNDEPGAAYADAVASKLSQIGCRVRLVPVPAGKPLKWDAGDCVAEGGDPAELIAGAVEVTRQSIAEKPLITAKPFVLKDPRKIPKRQWVYGRHLIRKFGSATFAPSSSGKSNLFIVEALAAITGRPLLDITPAKPVRVWYWNGEDPMDELERRVGAACIYYKINARDIEGRLFINSGRDKDSKVTLATQTRDGVAIAIPMVKALIETIKENQIDIVQIDPFISSHRVTENDNNAVDAVAKTWTEIADVTNTAIDLAHHTRKTGGNEVTVEDGRGAVALLNAVRPARVINIMTEEEASKAGISDGRRRYFRVTDGKNNMALPSDKMDWFRSATVKLENGDPSDLLDHGDEMGVVTKWEWPNPMDGVTGADFDRAAAAICAGKWRKDVQCKDWVGIAVAKALNLKLTNKANKAKVIGLIKVWMAQGSLVEVEREDDWRKVKTFVEVASDG